MRAAVVVVGDLGRSPRMQYHARALATAGVDVDLIGYEGAPLPQFLTDSENPRSSSSGSQAARLAANARRSSSVSSPSIDAIRASVRLGVALMTIRRPDLLLVQSPPAMPTLQVAWFVARLRRRAARHRLAQSRLHHPRAQAGPPPLRRAARALAGDARSRGARTRTCASRGGSRGFSPNASS